MLESQLEDSAAAIAKRLSGAGWSSVEAEARSKFKRLLKDRMQAAFGGAAPQLPERVRAAVDAVTDDKRRGGGMGSKNLSSASLDRLPEASGIRELPRSLSVLCLTNVLLDPEASAAASLNAKRHGVGRLPSTQSPSASRRNTASFTAQASRPQPYAAVPPSSAGLDVSALTFEQFQRMRGDREQLRGAYGSAANTTRSAMAPVDVDGIMQALQQRTSLQQKDSPDRGFMFTPSAGRVQ